MNPRQLWHYTTRQCFQKITADGVIKLATANVAPRESPAVWFSFHQVWEPTATKGIVEGGFRRTATIEEMTRIGGGLVRIGVSPEVAPHTWVRFRYLSGVDPSHAKALAFFARKMGADPNNWRASFDPVPSVSWRGVEELVKGAWVRLGLANGGCVHGDR